MSNRSKWPDKLRFPDLHAVLIDADGIRITLSDHIDTITHTRRQGAFLVVGDTTKAHPEEALTGVEECGYIFL